MDVHTVPNPAKSLLGFRPLSNEHEDDLPESDIESSDAGSENGDMSDLQMDPDKMDPAHREFLVKLKRQEQEERAEIERELRAHKEALARRSAELRAAQQQQLPAHGGGIGGGPDSKLTSPDPNQGEDLSINNRNKHSSDHSSGSEKDSPSSDDLRSPAGRPDSILAQHGISLKASDKANSMDALAQAYGLDRSFSHSPPGSGQDSIGTPSHHWTFEEQFKQLYEISDDPKRKEFLDELFAFMQKRGTPVNRIPIMAKQTLDLYELFKLVVNKGGLVEVINKKLWREITKGLNLPSSITSAAFTLRTQYMKYLYPYECEKLKLSSPQELQSAIDGNRREGRRPSYGSFDMSPGPTLLPQSPHLNGSMMNGRPNTGTTAAESRQYNIFDAYRVSPLFLRPLWDLSTRPAEKPNHNQSDDEGSLPSTPNPPPNPRSMTERDALAMEAASRAMEEATRKLEASRSNLTATAHEEAPPRKRMALSEEDRLLAHAGLPSAHIKLTSRSDGRADFDNSLVVSMEINGIMYQGVLFAQTTATAHAPRRI